jgi:hypothetical protein
MSAALPAPSPDWISHVADRSDWAPEGPWTSEPDKELWMTAAGLPGAVVRHRTGGHLCGYVAVPSGHAAYAMTVGDILGHDGDRPPAERIARTPRGVSFAAAGSDPLDMSESLEAGWWWIGFDCAHSFDLDPRRAPGNPIGYTAPRRAEYATWEEVRGLVEEFAEWLGRGMGMGGRSG